MPFVGGAPLERLKKLGQSLAFDNGPSVAYLDAHISVLAPTTLTSTGTSRTP